MAIVLKFEGFTPRFRGGRVCRRCRGGSKCLRGTRLYRSPLSHSQRLHPSFFNCALSFFPGKSNTQARSTKRQLPKAQDLASHSSRNILSYLPSKSRFLNIPPTEATNAKTIITFTTSKERSILNQIPPATALKNASFVFAMSTAILRLSLSIVHLIALAGGGWTDRRGSPGLTNHLFDAIEGFGLDVVGKPAFEPVRIPLNCPIIDTLRGYTKQLGQLFVCETSFCQQLSKSMLIHLHPK